MKNIIPLPTLERLRELFEYNDGKLVRRIEVRSGGKSPKGAIVGTPSTRGYLCIGIDGKSYRVHRVIWLLVTGRPPSLNIDHINGVTSDNRIENLREATQSKNCQNRRKRKSAISPYKGVTRTRHGRWIARIRDGKKHRYLGTFPTQEEAHAVYFAAAKALFGEFARAA